MDMHRLGLRNISRHKKSKAIATWIWIVKVTIVLIPLAVLIHLVYFGRPRGLDVVYVVFIGLMLLAFLLSFWEHAQKRRELDD